MKILVPVKRVIDYNVKVRVKADNTDVDLANVKMDINPFCDIAVEEAVRLKEQGVATEIIVVSIGEAKAEEQIRRAMAIGADRGILIQTEQPASSLTVAKLLQSLIEQEQPQLVILGKQSIDSDNNQTGQMLAELSGLAQGTFASKLEIKDQQALVTREIDGGLQTVSLNLPAIVTTDLRLNEPRYVKLPDIMKAKRKPLEKKVPADFSVAERKSVQTLSVEAPPKREAGIMVNSVGDLLEKLKNEAKVLS